MGSELGNTADTKPVMALDGVGIFWLVFGTAWTLTLIAAMVFLYLRRNMPILRIRGLPLSFMAVFFLHVYWICVQFGYVYGPLMPEVAEYWIMGIYLPWGIALFQASNSRFLYIANAQKRFMSHPMENDRVAARRSKKQTLLTRWRQLDFTHKSFVLVALGMLIHAIITIFMFLVSRKFHNSFGIPGTEVHGTPMEVKVAQGRGWEWWPSIFWQFFWAWIFAPFILWRSRRVHDTQGWRVQTIACCLSSLHAAPMWLIALYVPGMAPVNKYFIPPQWICVSIMMLEIFTIFIPCWEVRKQNALCQETLESIARWESRQKSSVADGKSLNSDWTGSTWLSRMGGRAASVHTADTGNTAGSRGSILTMEALEHTLSKNPEPLQEFSALKDFSGENIAFLTKIKEWKLAFLPPSTKDHSEKDGEKDGEKDFSQPKILSRECFEGALRIYIQFISNTAAEFQVNLSSQDFKNLQDVFEEAASILCGDTPSPDPATPFDSPRHSEDDKMLENLRYIGDIPDNFDESVFDDAEMSIKYLVLTNTWPKFIKSRRSFDAASGSVESGR